MPRVKVQKVFRRGGNPTKAEKDLVRQFVQDQPCEVKPSQVQALGRVLRRTPEAIAKLITEARETLADNAQFYVQTHRQAVEDALAMDSAHGKDIAIRGSQWAMENIGTGSDRIVEKEVKGPTGTQIMIGVKIGGRNAAVDVTPT